MLGKAVMVKKSPMERMAATNPASEIWWDSSPLVFDQWKTDTHTDAPADTRDRIAAWHERYYMSNRPAEQLLRGATTNLPSALEVVRSDRGFWREWAIEQKRRDPKLDARQVLWAMYLEIVKRGAERLLGIYHRSGFRWGHLAAEVDLRSHDRPERMKEQALQIAALASNIIVTVPATEEGIGVINFLTSQGIGTNASLCSTLAQIVAVAEAVLDGLARAKRNMADLSSWRSVISLTMRRCEEIGAVESRADQKGAGLTETKKRWFSIAILKKAIGLLMEQGSPSKLLMAEMGTGPIIGGMTRLWHFEKTAGADIVYACPGGYIRAVDQLGEALQFLPDAWRKPVPERVLDGLKKLEYFARVYDPDGLAPAEFSSHPAVVASLAAHSEATEAIQRFVADAESDADITSRIVPV